MRIFFRQMTQGISFAIFTKIQEGFIHHDVCAALLCLFQQHMQISSFPETSRRIVRTAKQDDVLLRKLLYRRFQIKRKAMLFQQWKIYDLHACSTRCPFIFTEGGHGQEQTPRAHDIEEAVKEFRRAVAEHDVFLRHIIKRRDCRFQGTRLRVRVVDDAVNMGKNSFLHTRRQAEGIDIRTEIQPRSAGRAFLIDIAPMLIFLQNLVLPSLM